MDLETAKAIDATVRMIDNVNDRSMLNGLLLDLTIVIAAALRRQGIFSADEVSVIDQSFSNTADDWPDGRAERARKVLDASKAVWGEAGRMARG